MPWVITNGKNYVYRDNNNKLATTPNVNLATTYIDRKSADKNCICLPKSMKHLDYKPLYVTLEPMSSASEPQKEIVIDPRGETKTGAVGTCSMGEAIRSATASVGIDEKYLDLDAFINQTANFQAFVRGAAKQIPMLVDGIKRADMEIEDIEHAIEFSQCNVVGGYRWYKMLRDVRERRRRYKDALKCIEILTTEHAVFAGTKDISKSYEGMKHRKYTPRALIELTDYFREREGATAV